MLFVRRLWLFGAEIKRIPEMTARRQPAKIGGDVLACDIGGAACPNGQPPGRMKLVPVTPEDEARRRRLLVESVLPGWIQRCGTDCIALWNQNLASVLGIAAPAD